ncbi:MULTISPECIES: hypothetical protein [unclassified Microbacterium]|uniref:hypothetical protein n=1 Tax=unclassified Microbacterium TaxID=2609290 RepID=UPI00301AEC31
MTLLSHQDSTEELNSVTTDSRLATGMTALLELAETDTMSEWRRARNVAPRRQGSSTVGAARSAGNPEPEKPILLGAPKTTPRRAAGIVALILAGADLREVAGRWQSRYGITGADGGLVSEQKCVPR